MFWKEKSTSWIRLKEESEISNKKTRIWDENTMKAKQPSFKNGDPSTPISNSSLTAWIVKVKTLGEESKIFQIPTENFPIMKVNYNWQDKK